MKKQNYITPAALEITVVQEQSIALSGNDNRFDHWDYKEMPEE